MKKLFNSKVIKKILGIGVFAFCSFSVFFSNSFAAITDVNLIATEEYYEWEKLSEEEKMQAGMPSAFSISIPDSVLNKYSQLYSRNLINNLVGNVNCELTDVSAVANDSRYSLADRLHMRVENQGNTNECWAFSVIKAMETNIALENNELDLKNFSERHMDYSSVKTFIDGINPDALNREAGSGGLPIMGLAYLTNGQGAVLENELPFEDSSDKISLNDLIKPVDTIVTDYTMFPKIVKEYSRDSKGNTVSVKYKDASGKEYTKDEVNSVREIIKEHLIKEGAVVSFNAGSKAKYYNNSDIFKSTAYNCNDSSVIRDHAVTIVGWDDNYSKENFKDGTRPSTNGAYIVLNTYGDTRFDSGYMYVSYEDTFIESELYGICSTSKVDYDKLYQYDKFGGILKLGSSNTDTGYCGVTYSRDENKKEILNYVGISIPDYINVEIYVNPNGSSLDLDDLVKVASSSSVLEPGYHRIKIAPIELTGKEYSVVVKQISENNGFNFEIEGNVKDTAYVEITSENKSFISFNGKDWSNISNLNVSGVDMTKSDVCIKAFTNFEEQPDEPVKPEQPDEPETPEQPDIPEQPDDPGEEPIKFESSKYKIEMAEGYIKRIEFNTSIRKFLENMDTDLKIQFFDSEDNEIQNQDELVKTGMKIKVTDEKDRKTALTNSQFILVVRGDINLDGMLNLVDLSKLILHYNGNEGFELKGNSLLGADMNTDGVINLVDISQMLVLYNSI